MEIAYPIFLQDRDKYMYMITSASEVSEELENIDIEEREYISWDAKGRPLEFYLKDNEIKNKIISSEPQLEKLKEAILSYAKVVRPKSPFIYSGSEENMFELFKAVEEHIKSESVIKKLKRLFRK